MLVKAMVFIVLYVIITLVISVMSKHVVYTSYLYLFVRCIQCSCYYSNDGTSV